LGDPLENEIEICLEECGVKLDTIMIGVDLAEQSVRHRRQTAQLIGRRSKQLDWHEGTDSIVSARQPFEDFAGAAEAIDSSGRRRAFNGPKDVAGVEKPPSIAELLSRLAIAPLDGRNLPGRLQTPHIGSGLRPRQLILDTKRLSHLIGQGQAIVVTRWHQSSTQSEE
jgi:hypothetical protein